VKGCWGRSTRSGAPRTDPCGELARGRQIASVAFRCAAGDPASDRGEVGLGEPALPDELPVSLSGLPWRHLPLLHCLEDLVPSPVDVLVLDQLERRAACGSMALLAVLLKDPS
jgi:hypothetical protein